MKNPKIFYVKRLPMKWAWGMAVPPFGIFIRKDQIHNERLMRHEMIHWDQYISRGVIKFYAGYLFLWASSGFSYKNHPWEIEAKIKSQE